MVRTPDRRKARRVVHVNILRKCIVRVTDYVTQIALVTVTALESRDVNSLQYL